jgi:ribosome biogenesis GTPase
LDQAFPEIHDLAEGCHFADCRHGTEPGCAVRAAEAAGALDPDRLASFRKLQAEAEWQLGKPDGRAQKAALSEHKSALKTMKCHHKLRGPE